VCAGVTARLKPLQPSFHNALLNMQTTLNMASCMPQAFLLKDLRLELPGLIEAPVLEVRAAHSARH
jgi:hypothetical protein